jgi:hypothetical protein
VEELLTQYIQDLLTLIATAWQAPKEQARHYIGALGGQAFKLLIFFLLGRWLWEKIIKRK